MGFWRNLKLFFLGPEKCRTIYELRAWAAGDPYKLKDYAKKFFLYKADETLKEDWLPAEEAFNRLQKDGDDCEAYAAVDHFCLDGYKRSHIVYVSNGTEAHAICVYENAGRWHYLDNHHHPDFDFRTIADCCRDVYSNVKIAYYCRWNGTRYVKGESIEL
ncbi:MAG TPA: hypothetical protein PLZ78_08890 [Spirochaetota bacterium]|nr:hypothetical protein [Spirochaetota bacterium]